MADTSHLERMGRELKCPICLSLFNSAVSLYCNHVFCNECILKCILKSMKMDATCPLCKIPYHRREIRGAPHMDSLVSIYKNMEDAYGVNVFVSQNNPSPSDKEKHVNKNESLLTEPPDLSNWFSSYIYESPSMDTSYGFEFSDLGESECLKFDCTFSEPNKVVEDSDIDEEIRGPSIFRRPHTKTNIEDEVTSLRNRVGYLEDEVRKLHDLINHFISSNGCKVY